MQLTAKLVQVLPLQKGAGKNGEWKKQDIIVETEGQYPKKVCVSIWGDKINESQLRIGAQLKIDFDVESREYNGRWYTDVKAWRVEAADGAAGGAGGQTRSNAGGQWDNSAPATGGANDEDLPF